MTNSTSFVHVSFSIKLKLERSPGKEVFISKSPEAVKCKMDMLTDKHYLSSACETFQRIKDELRHITATVKYDEISPKHMMSPYMEMMADYFKMKMMTSSQCSAKLDQSKRSQPGHVKIYLAASTPDDDVFELVLRVRLKRCVCGSKMLNERLAIFQIHRNSFFC